MIISGIILTALGDKGQVLGLALNSINKKFNELRENLGRLRPSWIAI